MVQREHSWRYMEPTWTLATNHGAVWMLVAKEGTVTAQSVALRLGIAIRSTQRILAELEQAGYITEHHREGRANHYEVNLSRPMRRRGLGSLPIGTVFGAFLSGEATGNPQPTSPQVAVGPD